MEVIAQNIVIGGVEYIDIDDHDYAISADGCEIQKIADLSITPVVGRPEPRIKERSSYYTVTVNMLENTLEMLKLAWNQPNTISYATDLGGVFDVLYLGINQDPTVHAITVRGMGGIDENRSQVREWHFRKAVSYESHMQSLGPTATVYIPVTFYCYPDSSQASGQEFGYVGEDHHKLIMNQGFEVAGAGGADVYAEWYESDGGSGGSVNDETTSVYQGSHAVKLTTGPTGIPATVYQYAYVVPTRKYILYLHSRGDGSDAGQYQVLDSTHSQTISGVVSTGNSSTGYKPLTYKFTVPAGCTQIRVNVYSPDANNAIAYFDEVQVYRASA